MKQKKEKYSFTMVLLNKIVTKPVLVEVTVPARLKAKVLVHVAENVAANKDLTNLSNF
jgi:hypothetical protein